MMWFETLTGFRESSPQQVRANIGVDGERMTSYVNGKVMTCGRLGTPSLAELRARVRGQSQALGRIAVREMVADVQALHTNEAHAGALFQVASQFNLLEMTSPRVTPERGIGIYEHDHTQGPACAIAAGAGTIYRNYFVPLSEQIGQSTETQIDCLADLGVALGNTDNRLWAMKNGYLLASREGLAKISVRLRAASEKERDALRGLIRIGLQWDTQVTLDNCEHLVSQAYCSALPVAYSAHAPRRWQPFAELVLEAAYEATILAAILNARRTGNPTCHLTLLGGGAFGNATDWIIDAIQRALTLYAGSQLDVVIVSYGAAKPALRPLLNWSLIENATKRAGDEPG